MLGAAPSNRPRRASGRVVLLAAAGHQGGGRAGWAARIQPSQAGGPAGRVAGSYHRTGCHLRAAYEQQSPGDRLDERLHLASVRADRAAGLRVALLQRSIRLFTLDQGTVVACHVTACQFFVISESFLPRHRLRQSGDVPACLFGRPVPRATLSWACPNMTSAGVFRATATDVQLSSSPLRSLSVPVRERPHRVSSNWGRCEATGEDEPSREHGQRQRHSR